MLWSRYVIGYHGCDADLVNEIVAQKKDLKPSENDYDWLGDGIYFWEGSYQRAFDWASNGNPKDRERIKNPGVLGAVIDLGECLNLIESEYLELVQQAFKNMQALFELGKLEMPRNAGADKMGRTLDCAVFRFLHESRKRQNLSSFDTIRAFFVEGEELYPGARINHKDHIQICVCNPSQIIGYFLPRQKL